MIEQIQVRAAATDLNHQGFAPFEPLGPNRLTDRRNRQPPLLRHADDRDFQAGGHQNPVHKGIAIGGLSHGTGGHRANAVDPVGIQNVTVVPQDGQVWACNRPSQNVSWPNRTARRSRSRISSLPSGNTWPMAIRIELEPISITAIVSAMAGLFACLPVVAIAQLLHQNNIMHAGTDRTLLGFRVRLNHNRPLKDAFQ